MNAQDLKNLAEAYTQLSTKKDDSYLETDMKKRQDNNEKARKAMEKMGKMKNPHFGEEVKGQDTEMRKAAAAERKAGDKKLSPSEGKANADKMQRDIKFYNKLTKEGLDPVGKEDGDVNNDGKKDSTDKYLMKRRAAIGKAMGKKKMSEGVRDMDPEKGTAERKARLEIKRGMKMDDHPQYNKKKTEQYESNPKFKKEEVEQVDEDSRRTSNKQHSARVRSNIKSFGSDYTPPKNYDPDANRGKGEVLTDKQVEKKRRKSLRQEELELSGKFTAEEIEKILEIMGEGWE
jgi:hypothetical protein